MNARAQTAVIAAALGVLAVNAACTPAQRAAWLEWHTAEPDAALAFLETDVYRDLSDDAAPDVRRGDVWDRLAECEAGGNWDYNGGSGYDGGLQFLPSTWRAYNGADFAEYAWQATREQQIAVAERVLADAGWRAWPTCSRRLGLR